MLEMLALDAQVPDLATCPVPAVVMARCIGAAIAGRRAVGNHYEGNTRLCNLFFRYDSGAGGTMETRGNPDDVWKAIQKHRIAMLATEEGGQLVSRPMASYGHAKDERIYFITHRDNNIARPGETIPVNLAYADADKNSYLSVSGVARLNQDRQKLHELWSVWAEAWLPQGPEAVDVALIAVEPHNEAVGRKQQTDLRSQDAEGRRNTDTAPRWNREDHRNVAAAATGSRDKLGLKSRNYRR